MQLVISSTGTIRCLYDESLDLHKLGKLSISRGSHVEPNEAGLWYTDLAPVGGPQLGPFGSRSAALTAEVRWLEEHWLSLSDD
ncbi:hypothetical protein [Bremerella sp. P1]|uniref:hypothetical protein n=1 Tax=Bremerella sp. P1 TaxID=3026424 RepID=UPI0023677B1C|nr:hypothetical protein [Bremerella sp. P1]WDI42523.1 hypothetical protein PSR63_01010 [Bremerella sp. P1]